MTERAKFVLEWYRRWDEGEGRANMAALCRAFGISRETGYVWVRRYRDAGNRVEALVERSRRPKTNPRQVDAAMEDGLVRLKKHYPYWGPRKLKAWLETRRPEQVFPAASTIGAVLKRNGLVTKRRKRQRTPPHTQPFGACGHPNSVWCVDFKGNFRVGDGTRCYPLTISDAHSRFLLRCEGLEETHYAAVRAVFESAFEEFGLPAVIRSDNGAPFATKGAGGLSELSAWWIRLGIRPERIEPGKPQQNGRHERMHLTLKKETALPPRASMRAQQRRFDAFRREYNDERPHEALGLRTPAAVYSKSNQRYTKREPQVAYDACAETVAVDALGRFRWGRSRVHVNAALQGQRIELRAVDEHRWEVRYGPITLGLIDGVRPSRGLIRPRQNWRQVSGMSPVSSVSEVFG
jgi:putative transposase